MIGYGMSYCERKGLNTSDLTEAQRTLYYIAENMRMDEKISKDGYEDFQKAIEALEQQPCEDCVSRKLLSDNICEGISCNECSFKEIDGECGCLLQKRFDKLPSVTPTRPTGRWIDIGDEGIIFKCSSCGMRTTIESHFCPDCGTRMAESEDKE